MKAWSFHRIWSVYGDKCLVGAITYQLFAVFSYYIIIPSFQGRLGGSPGATATRRKIPAGGDRVSRHQMRRALLARGVHEDAVLQTVDNFHHRGDVAVRVNCAALGQTETSDEYIQLNGSGAVAYHLKYQCLKDQLKPSFQGELVPKYFLKLSYMSINFFQKFIPIMQKKRNSYCCHPTLNCQCK